MARTIPLDELHLAPREPQERPGHWLDRALRAAIRSGQLRADMRLPSSRRVSEQHGVARGTVLQVFDQLATEGYLQARRGSGTFVSALLPEEFFRARSTRVSAGAPRIRAKKVLLSTQGEALTRSPFHRLPMKGPPRAFRPYLPAVDGFPLDVWARLYTRCLRRVSREPLLGQDEFGWRPLQQAIADHLAFSRGVVCQPEQIMVVSGTQQALDFVGRLLLEPGDAVWREDPGYPGAAAIFRAQGAKVVPVPVDKQGMTVAAGLLRAPKARLAYVTPANQFPLGVVLSLERRIQLLQWAARSGAWIFEDDYDSEFRFVGQPLAAMQGIDPEANVIYSCSFNKMLFPTLRLGLLLLPKSLVEPARAARSLLDRYPPALEQRVLCDFIAEGHFGRHLRRMRQIYAERHATLVEAISSLEGRLTLSRCDTGLQVAGWLSAKSRRDDRQTAAHMAAQGVELAPLSSYAIEWPNKRGVHLGFASVGTKELKRGVELLRKHL